jgi:MoxR-like ATPase
MIPATDKTYVNTPYFEDLKLILDSGTFFPVLITGPSGVGKTITVEQVCAATQRNLYRVNITIESDEDSLMGGWRLVDGNTVFFKGPVIEAMENGSILLLDEIDLGSPTKIMCLQSVLEGKGYFIKRTGEWVAAKEGFMIIATANTKGLGDETGRYMGTQMLNEAALDRFPVTFEAGYPNKTAERRIINHHAKQNKIAISTEQVNILLAFAGNIRKTVESSSEISYNISTRRLVDIVRAFAIYGDLEKSLVLCTARFDAYHQASFLKYFRALIEPEKDSKKMEVDYSKVRNY